MKKIIDWFKASNRWKHLLGGIAVGAGANDTYCAIYTGVLVSATLELKDKLYGGKPDFVDFLLTIIGVAIGHTLRRVIFP